MAIATELEQYMLELVNADRAARGLSVLRLEQNLNESADVHSQWMTDADTFSHDGAGGSTATERMLAAGMDLSGRSWGTAENVAAVSVNGAGSYLDEVDRLHTNLMNSPGHRANLLNPDLEYIGIGIAFGPLTYYDASGDAIGRAQSVLVTQNFAHTDGLADLQLVGGSGAERLTGAGGTDYIEGAGGKDLLIGSTGTDTLFGGAGSDILIGDDRGFYGSDHSAQIFRLFNAVFGREPGGAGHQSWSVQLATGAMTLDEVAAAMIDGPEFQATYGNATNAEFVTLLFQNVLGRAPAQAGLEAWQSNLDRGMSREEVVRRISEGGENVALTRDALEEFEASNDPTIYAPQIYRLYQAVFGREPAVAGFESWMTNFENGMRFEEAVTQFMATPEFTRVYGAADNETFINTLFTNVLGRAPAQSGLDAWVRSLESGTSREEVVRLFVDGPEFIARTANALKDFMAANLEGGDTLVPEAGDSILTGGLGSDVFVFNAQHDGNHVISDLEAWDFIELEQFNYGTIDALRDHLFQEGEDVIFADQGVTVLIENTTLAQIGDDQFIF